MPGGDQTQARRQHGFEADRAGLGFGERHALGLDILRIVIGHDDIEQARRQSLDEGEPILFVAQRRRDFQKRPIIADVVLVERQMIDRGAAGHRQARRLGPCHDRQREACRNERRVIARADEIDEAHVAVEHDRFGFARNAGQGRGGSPIRPRSSRPTGEIGDPRMMHDQGAEIPRIGQRAAHDLGAAHRMRAVGEGDGAGFLQQADLGDLAAFEPFGDGRRRAAPARARCRGRDA